MSARGVVVGARRRRQGIGGFLATALQRAGAEIVGVVGTSDASAREASEALAEEGLEAQPYGSLQAALSAERPDFVALCSPYEFHRAQLGAVARAGCHCLCEKPLWWDDAVPLGQTKEAITRALVLPFQRSGHLLRLVTQWPCTLGTYRRLFATSTDEPPREFQMTLSPARPGVEMVIDSGSHPLSMLQALCGPGRLDRAGARFADASLTELTLEGRYLHRSGATEFGIRLRVCPKPPRPAGYGLDGHFAQRIIELPDYRQQLCAQHESVELPDPLDLLAQRFVEAMASGTQTDVELLVQSVEHLDTLVRVTAAAEASARRA